MKKPLQTGLRSAAAACLALAAAACATTKPRPTANEREPVPGGVWSAEVDAAARSLVSPPEKIPAFSRFLLGFAEREFDKELLPGRVLTWSSDLGVASGALELYVEKGVGKILEPRMAALLRVQVSYAASCPFAVDVNAFEYPKHNITEDEIRAMQGRAAIDDVATFSEREKAALRFALAMTATPVRFNQTLLTDLRRLFTHEEIVAVAALAAKVNYWARFIEAMRIKPAGYTDDPLLGLADFGTFAGEE